MMLVVAIDQYKTWGRGITRVMVIAIVQLKHRVG